MGYYADLIKQKQNANDTYGVFEVGGGLVEKCTSRIEADRLKRIWEKRLPKSKFEVDALPRNEKEENENAKTVNFLGQTYTFGEDKKRNSEIWQKLMHDGSNARAKAQDEYKTATREANEKYRKIDSDITKQIDNLYSQLKAVLNSKEEKDNDAAQTAYEYALKLAKQTGDPNFFKVLHRSREHFLANPHLISEWIDEMKSYMKKAGITNSEEGYYAKLIEEKASRNH